MKTGRSPRWPAVVLAGLLAVMPAMARAQDDVPDLKKQIKALTERLDRIETQQQRAPFPGEALERKPSPPQAQTVYDEGFWFVGPDDKLKIGGATQFDGRFYEGGNPSHDTFQVRRTRLYATGVLEHIWGYMVMAKWDRGTPALHFAWLEYQQYPFARLRLGQFKQPYSLEGVNSDHYFDFNERSLWVANLLQLEDLGVMAHGKLWGQRLEYGLGVFNGRGANKDDANDEKETVGQLTLVPFRVLDAPGWKGLHLSLSGSDSKMEDDLKGSTFKTAAQTPFWTFAGAVIPKGRKTRTSAEAEWFIGPGSLKGGIHRAALNTLRFGTVEKDLAIDGWVVSGSYILTGEKKLRNKPVIPAAEFNPGERGGGAVEIAARYEQFRGQRDLLTAGFFTGTAGVSAWTVGLNWYLNRHMRCLFHYQDTRFDDPVAVHGENIDGEKTLMFRTQFEI